MKKKVLIVVLVVILLIVLLVIGKVFIDKKILEDEQNQVLALKKYIMILWKIMMNIKMF